MKNKTEKGGLIDPYRLVLLAVTFYLLGEAVKEFFTNLLRGLVPNAIWRRVTKRPQYDSLKEANPSLCGRLVSLRDDLQILYLEGRENPIRMLSDMVKTVQMGVWKIDQKTLLLQAHKLGQPRHKKHQQVLHVAGLLARFLPDLNGINRARRGKKPTDADVFLHLGRKQVSVEEIFYMEDIYRGEIGDKGRSLVPAFFIKKGDKTFLGTQWDYLEREAERHARVLLTLCEAISKVV